MTDKPSPTDPELSTPSDAEIIMLDVESGVSVRAGKGAVKLAGRVPTTPDQIAKIADAAHREYDRLVSSGQCVPRWSAVFAHLLEMHHGIKGGQHVS